MWRRKAESGEVCMDWMGARSSVASSLISLSPSLLTRSSDVFADSYAESADFGVLGVAPALRAAFPSLLSDVAYRDSALETIRHRTKATQAGLSAHSLSGKVDMRPQSLHRRRRAHPDCRNAGSLSSTEVAHTPWPMPSSPSLAAHSRSRAATPSTFDPPTFIILKLSWDTPANQP